MEISLKFIDVLMNIEASIGRNICTCEHKLVVYLYDCGPSPAKAIRPFCKVSTSKFFEALNRLSVCEVLQIVDLEAKIRLYRLTDKTISTIDNVIYDLNHWFMSKCKNKTSAFSNEFRYAQEISRRGIRSPNFYCDYQIIRYLYEMNRLTSNQLRDLCSWSDTIFYTAISSIVEAGLVIRKRHEKDKRKVFYQLSPRTRKSLDVELEAFRSWYIQQKSSIKARTGSSSAAAG